MGFKTPRIFHIAVFCLIACTACFLVPETADAKGNPKYASIVIDADTGMVLSQSHADRVLHPASLAKMMTLLLTFDALERGDLKLSDRVVFSRHAASMVPSKLDIPAGQSIRVEDAIYALVTKSANDVAVALAEKVGGSENQFAYQMTSKAREIGMSSTRFRNASGLHDPRQVTTARDMAKLAAYIIRTYPQYYSYFSTRNFSYQGKSYHNHNRLLGVYKGMDGFKTGYVQASGFNLVASAKRDNQRIIGVVFGGRTARSRNDHMVSLLDKGFSKMETIRIASAKIPVPSRKPVTLMQVAALDNMAPAAGNDDDDDDSNVKWADLNPMLQNQAFQNIIGQGDYDPAITSRFETGLMAIAAHKERQAPPSTGIQTVAYTSPQTNKGWAIQVGAFASRVKTDKAIARAQKKLPPTLADSKTAMIAPLKTGDGWLFRGRIAGFTKNEALRACRYLRDCLPVSPQAY
ncbi:MAG: D-alanyl-D-alanine carboxypeptidase [Rhodospirillales bacterium]|nr:D-alanyl-D-alanine carboxypeptidase [Rhodospirillales bacterium]